jgi:hypothetical protein
VIRLAGLFFIGSSLFGQFSYGVIGGIPFNDAITGGANSNTLKIAETSGRHTIGPTVQLALPFRLRVEIDALYRPISYNLATAGLPPIGFSPPKTSGSQWRLPVLLQYRLATPILKPFVEAGYSYEHVGIAPQQYVSVLSGPVLIAPSASRHGFILGAGLDFKVPFVRVSPELRYTRQSDIGSDSLLTNNQAEFLIGIRF